MKIIYNKIIPFQGFKCINLFGILFVRSKLLKDKDINHEAIHSEQMKELLWIPFYLWYVIEYLFRAVRYWSLEKAYKTLWFEQEAYDNQENLDYLKTRKHYKWFNYHAKSL